MRDAALDAMQSALTRTTVMNGALSSLPSAAPLSLLLCTDDVLPQPSKRHAAQPSASLLRLPPPPPPSSPAAVFDYWVQKRARRAKPIMRRLQVPTALTDTSPYNVFRPREKIQRRASARPLSLSPHALPSCRRVALRSRAA